MKLLILTSNPERASFRQRIGNYLDTFRTCGIEPTVLVLEQQAIRRAAQFRQIDDYDVILLHKKCLNFVDGLFFRPRRAKVVFSYDDAIMFNDKGHQTPTHTARFRRSVKKACKILVGSSYLADCARAYHNDIVVLPLGLNTSDYNPNTRKCTDGKIRIVWMGSAATLDYIRPLSQIFQTLSAKYPVLVVRLVGDTFFDIEGVTVEKIKWQAQTRARSIAECDIGLAPLPDNPFTRGKCSFKVLEYSASGLPVVASPIGTNADHIQEGQTGFLADTPDRWLEKLSILIENPALRIQMGQCGINFAKNFDISVVGQKFCDLIRNMVE